MVTNLKTNVMKMNSKTGQKSKTSPKRRYLGLFNILIGALEDKDDKQKGIMSQTNFLCFEKYNEYIQKHKNYSTQMFNNL